jgi:hypothetical protein
MSKRETPSRDIRVTWSSRRLKRGGSEMNLNSVQSPSPVQPSPSLSTTYLFLSYKSHHVQLAYPYRLSRSYPAFAQSFLGRSRFSSSSSLGKRDKRSYNQIYLRYGRKSFAGKKVGKRTASLLFLLFLLITHSASFIHIQQPYVHISHGLSRNARLTKTQCCKEETLQQVQSFCLNSSLSFLTNPFAPYRGPARPMPQLFAINDQSSSTPVEDAQDSDDGDREESSSSLSHDVKMTVDDENPF